jgi:hypothetical protein
VVWTLFAGSLVVLVLLPIFAIHLVDVSVLRTAPVAFVVWIQYVGSYVASVLLPLLAILLANASV